MESSWFNSSHFPIPIANEKIAKYQHNTFRKKRESGKNSNKTYGNDRKVRWYRYEKRAPIGVQCTVYVVLALTINNNSFAFNFNLQMRNRLYILHCGSKYSVLRSTCHSSSSGLWMLNPECFTKKYFLRHFPIDWK